MVSDDSVNDVASNERVANGIATVKTASSNDKGNGVTGVRVGNGAPDPAYAAARR
ncbi:hypothetical protein [Nannocystis pusilla]|uniref:hypothetical protein n=1 Tax=Nannocystis pusilla TaxID=889268 RepID=UPI003B7694D6